MIGNSALGYPKMYYLLINLTLRKMKKLTMILVAIIMSISLMAQEKTKQKEVGLVFNNLDQFGVSYKSGTNKSLWRYSLLLMSGSNVSSTSDYEEQDNKRFGAGLKFGKEYRKEISEKLEFRYGADVSFSYSKSETESENDVRPRFYNSSTSYRPGFNFVFGMNYLLNEHFAIGAEVLPYFEYNIEKRSHEINGEDIVESNGTGIYYGLNSSYALLSLSYRF